MLNPKLLTFYTSDVTKKKKKSQIYQAADTSQSMEKEHSVV